MSSKHVNFDDAGNSTKEFERISSQEKGSVWYSKEEKESNRKELQTEVLMEQAEVLVTKTVLEMEDHQGQTEESEEVHMAVQAVLAQGMDGVFDFLTKHGQDIMPPAENEASASSGATDAATDIDPSSPSAEAEASIATKFSIEDDAATDAEAKHQVRNLVKHQVVVLMQSGDSSFVSHEDSEEKVDEIMKLPRMEILRFLEQKAKLPASTAPAEPLTPYNWAVDGKHEWQDLPPLIQEAAQVLGYNAESWGTDQQPEQSDKVWEDLSPKQQEAAIKIGYNAHSWDGIEPTEREEDDVLHESSSSSDSDSDDEKEEIELSQEDLMTKTIRDMLRQKFLGNEAFNDDNVDATVDTVMELPKPQIKAFLQHPIPPSWTMPKAIPEEEEDETEVSGEDGEVVSSFMLSRDEDDTKPMDDDDDTSVNGDDDVDDNASSSNEEEEPHIALGSPEDSHDVRGSSSNEEDDGDKKKPRQDSFKVEEDEFLANFLSDDDDDDLDTSDKENASQQQGLAAASHKNVGSPLDDETAPLISSKANSRSLPSGGNDPKKGPSKNKIIIIGLGGAGLGWLLYKVMR